MTTNVASWAQPPAALVSTSAATVRVSEFGADQVTLDYVAGLTVGEYLRQAEVLNSDRKGITLNGVPATVNDKVDPNSVLVVSDNITNG